MYDKTIEKHCKQPRLPGDSMNVQYEQNFLKQNYNRKTLFLNNKDTTNLHFRKKKLPDVKLF